MPKKNENNEKNKVFELIKEAISYIPERTEEEMYDSFDQVTCPYEKCDGSGYHVVKKKNNRTFTEWCQCYKEEVLRRKLKTSNIESKFWNASFELKEANVTLLHPKKELEPPKMIKKGRKEVPETADEYIERVYKKMPIEKGVAYFTKEYTNKTLEFLKEKPRNRSKNLMLMGEPGRGKTHLACAIGKAYLEKGKSVHFTTMLNLVSDVMNPEVKIREIVRKKDLLIVDEVGYEYHTDTQWALKQIKELFRLRYNSHLPIICTTNFYPNELAELYDSSLMSMFNGSYFYILVEQDHDFRLEEASDALKDFTFVEDE